MFRHATTYIQVHYKWWMWRVGSYTCEELLNLDVCVPSFLWIWHPGHLEQSVEVGYPHTQWMEAPWGAREAHESRTGHHSPLCLGEEDRVHSPHHQTQGQMGVVGHTLQVEGYRRSNLTVIHTCIIPADSMHVVSHSTVPTYLLLLTSSGWTQIATAWTYFRGGWKLARAHKNGRLE